MILAEETQSLIALSRNGYAFRLYAASALLSLFGCYTECHYWMIVSALTRQDGRAVVIFLQDWSKKRLTKIVTKFVPGAHYHVDDTKYDSLIEAKDHIKQSGYDYGGLIETHVYSENGG